MTGYPDVRDRPTLDRPSRRSVLGALGSIGAAGLAGCVSGGGGGGASGTVRIGVLQPITGDLAYYGQQSIWGFASGLAHKGEDPPLTGFSSEGTKSYDVGDVTYELVVRNTEFTPQTAQTKATDLVSEEEVDMLFGITSSGAAEQVINTVVSQSEVPIVVGPAASTSITSNSELCSDLVFRASENTAMDARSGGRFVAQETDVGSVYLMGADYSFGRSVVDNYEAVLREEGVSIAGRRLVPQGYEDFDGLFQNAVDAGADAVVGGFTVQTLPAFMTTAAGYDVRVFGGFATEITNTVVGNLLGNLLGTPLTAGKIRDAQVGPFTTRYHWNQYDNEINNSFVDTYTSTYGKVPDLFTSGTFTAASAIVQAVEASGSTEGADIAGAMKGMTVTDTPKGTDGYTFQEYNNQARSEMTVAYPVPTSDEVSGNWGAAIMPESPPTARIGKDRTTIPSDSDLMGCSL